MENQNNDSMFSKSADIGTVISAIVAIIGMCFSIYFSIQSNKNNRNAEKAEQSAQLTYKNIQTERNTILNDAFAQATHFGAVIRGQGSKNEGANITIEYNNQSGLPISDVYFILLPNNISLKSKKIGEKGMYFPMHVVDTGSDDIYLEEDEVDEKSIKNNYYVALLFKDSQGKYWANDCKGLNPINQGTESSILKGLRTQMRLSSK